MIRRPCGTPLKRAFMRSLFHPGMYLYVQLICSQCASLSAAASDSYIPRESMASESQLNVGGSTSLKGSMQYMWSVPYMRVCSSMKARCILANMGSVAKRKRQR